MSGTVIAVTTANRPDVLDRCVAAAVSGCGVAQEAHWVFIDDSRGADQSRSRAIARKFAASGLCVSYVDAAVEQWMANHLPGDAARTSFSRLTARPSAYRIPGSRNLALIAGLSLDPDILFFLDDDVVHRHDGEHCFF